jgi:hypothetical protein
VAVRRTSVWNRQVDGADLDRIVARDEPDDAPHALERVVGVEEQRGVAPGNRPANARKASRSSWWACT